MSYEPKLDIDQARLVVAEVIDKRKRWGIQLSYEDFNKDDLLDSLIVLQEDGIATANAQVAQANRQAGAYKAQIARGDKIKEQLRETIADLEGKLADRDGVILRMDGDIKKLEALLAARSKEAVE